MFVLVSALGTAAMLLTHLAPFPFLLETFHRGDSAWHMPASSSVVYLTYDDGPNPTTTPQILDTLQRENARATFFLIDDHVTTETAPIVRRMFGEGHSVAVHSNDRWLMAGAAASITLRLDEAARRLETVAGSRPCPWFRPHAGWRSAGMYEALDTLGYRLAGWTWGMWDWNWGREREGAALGERLAERARAGDVIVIHDGHHIEPRADRQYAIEATGALIPALRARQLEIAPLPCRPID
jgi:chitooligosaccharide deacetylase